MTTDGARKPELGAPSIWVVAPLVAGIVARMLQANPKLMPALVRDVLLMSTHPVPDASEECQDAGAVVVGSAVALAPREQHGPRPGTRSCHRFSQTA